MVPFPQRRSSAEQYLSHPQQIRSGCLGLSTNFGFDLGVSGRGGGMTRSLTILSNHGVMLFIGCRDELQEYLLR
jgi:hypothetical protein